METTATLTYRDGRIETRTGTSGMILTATRNSDNVHVDMEFDFSSREETIAAIGSLLTQLEEISGENFVAQCIAHYMRETGKVKERPGQPGIAIIKARSEKKR